MSALPRSVRLLIDGPADGCWNMGADEALVATAATGQATLRFYRWTPATLSLGYFQSIEDRKKHLASWHCPDVRRSTGGGAILHDRELTYSFACPAAVGSHGAAEDLYDLFHDTLRATLIGLGVSAARQETTERDRDDRFLCFERRSRGDLLCGDAKIVGSAQRRTRGVLLQHGSVLLARSEFAFELPGIAELSGVDLAADDLSAAWLERLNAAAGWSVERGEWTAEERDRAKIEAERYASEPWAAKR